MTNVDLSFHGTLASFFYEQLEQARTQQDRLGEDVEAYVVNLLTEHARRPNVAGRTTPALATQFLAAREHGPVALREVGDRALYIAGVVPRSLDRTPVSVAYVSGIGEAAYREIHVRKSSLGVFARLADRFREVVDLLGRIADREPSPGTGRGREANQPGERGASPHGGRRPSTGGFPGREDNLLALYERWRRGLDPRDARRLLDSGVLLDPETADILQ